MPQGIFIHDANHYLHPSSLDVMDVSDRDELAMYLRAMHRDLRDYAIHTH